ncbi:MAG: SDR family NAD(P)-dependent oxidoreductase [Actinomycetota bacterium]
MKDLAGRLALVTGAASGIGRCTALELGRQGAELLLVDVDGEHLGEVARELEASGAKAHPFCVDVSDWEQVSGLADLVHARWGPLDILVNNAGFAIYRDLVFTTMDEWEALLGANLWGLIHFCNAFVPGMMKRRSGHVVNVASWMAFFSLPGSGAYNSTKAAVDGYSSALRYELNRFHVKVTTVYPVIVGTRFYEEIQGNLWTRLGLKIVPLVAQKPEALAARIVKAIHSGRRRVLVGPPAFLAFYFGGLLDLFFEGVGRLVARLTCRREA